MPLTAEEQAELEELRAWKLQQSKSGRRFPEFVYEGPVSDVLSGLNLSARETMEGARELFGGEPDREAIERIRKMAGRSGFGTAGKVLGDVAQIALPGTALTKGPAALRALTKAPKALKAAAGSPLLADVAASGVHGYTKLPEKGDTRVENAVTELLLGLGGQGLAAVGGKLAKGAKVTPEARKIMDEGGYLTPGQAVEKPMLRMAENWMKMAPFSSPAVARLQGEAKESWAKQLMQKAAGGLTRITETGTKGMAQLKAAVTKGYDDAWDAARIVKSETTLKARNVMDQWLASSKLDDSSKAVVRSVKEAYDKFIPEGRYQEFDNFARKRLKRDETDRNMAIKDIRAVFREGFPEPAQAALKEMDDMYPSYLIVRKAANTSKALQNRGVFEPSEVVTSARSVVSESLSAVGDYKLYGDVMGGVDTVGRKEPSMLVDLAKGLFQRTPELGLPFKGMSNIATGNTAAQAAARAAAAKISPVTSPILRGAPTGAGVGTNLEEILFGQQEQY